MSRTAVIRKTNKTVVDDDEMFVVDLYENGKLIQVRELPDKSIYYAEDLAENWRTGVIQLLTE